MLRHREEEKNREMWFQRSGPSEMARRRLRDHASFDTRILDRAEDLQLQGFGDWVATDIGPQAPREAQLAMLHAWDNEWVDYCAKVAFSALSQGAVLSAYLSLASAFCSRPKHAPMGLLRAGWSRSPDLTEILWTCMSCSPHHGETSASL